jgi:hypothetical protein
LLKTKTMVAVITGDVKKSRDHNTNMWLLPLKEVLNQFGNSPSHWEIFRGDSFQLITTPQQALLQALLIKATMKQMKSIDIRMGIGVGSITHRSKNVTECNGEAFVNSGKAFDGLKGKTLAIKTSEEEVDHVLKVMLDLCMIIADRWSEKASEIIGIKLENPALNQLEIAQKLNKKGQGNISESLKRSGYDEIMEVVRYYQNQIKTYA